MLFWHRGALQLHVRSLKVATNLHEKEQTAVILTFNEEAQPTETASSAALALQFSDISFTTWIKTGWMVVGWVGVSFIPSIRSTDEAELLQARQGEFVIHAAEHQEVPEVACAIFSALTPGLMS